MVFSFPMVRMLLNDRNINLWPVYGHQTPTNTTMPKEPPTVSNWIELQTDLEVGCLTRIIVGGNPSRVSDRVAFIEKSPRVRLSHRQFGIECRKDGMTGVSHQDQDAWVYGHKGGSLKRRKAWCDAHLMLAGHILPDPPPINLFPEDIK